MSLARPHHGEEKPSPDTGAFSDGRLSGGSSSDEREEVKKGEEAGTSKSGQEPRVQEASRHQKSNGASCDTP
jgi:hypothetical protein